MEWISVKDQVPDSYDDVLVLEGDKYRVAWWDGSEWAIGKCPERIEVEYWMPIPHRRLWNEINNGEI